MAFSNPVLIYTLEKSHNVQEGIAHETKRHSHGRKSPEMVVFST